MYKRQVVNRSPFLALSSLSFMEPKSVPVKMRNRLITMVSRA